MPERASVRGVPRYERARSVDLRGVWREGEHQVTEGDVRNGRTEFGDATNSAIAMIAMAIAPHKVEVSTVMRKLADSERPPAALARTVAW